MGLDVFWTGKQGNIDIIKAMTEEMVFLCEDLKWEYKILTQNDKVEGYLRLSSIEEDRKGTSSFDFQDLQRNKQWLWREGIIIFPLGLNDDFIRELSFAFINGPEVPSELSYLLASAEDIDRTSDKFGEQNKTFKSTGCWRGGSSEAFALSILLMLMKRLWIPGLSFQTNYLEDFSAKQWAKKFSLFIRPASQVLEYFRSHYFRDLLIRRMSFSKTRQRSSEDGNFHTSSESSVTMNQNNDSVFGLIGNESHEQYPFNPPEEYSKCLHEVQRIVNQEDPQNLDALFETLRKCNVLDIFSCVSVWPDGLAALSKDRSILFFPIWELCANLPIFSQYFPHEDNVDKNSVQDFIDTCMPEDGIHKSYYEYFQTPKKEERSILFYDLLLIAKSYLEKEVISTDTNRIPMSPREANAVMKRLTSGRFHYWKELFIYPQSHNLFSFSWKLFPVLISFVGENEVEYHFSKLCGNIDDYVLARLNTILNKNSDIRKVGELVQLNEQQLKDIIGKKWGRKLKEELVELFEIFNPKNDSDISPFDMKNELFAENLPPTWPLINLHISQMDQCRRCLYNQANMKVKTQPFCALRKEKIDNEFEQFCLNFTSKDKVFSKGGILTISELLRPIEEKHRRRWEQSFTRTILGDIYQVSAGTRSGFLF